MRFMLQDWFRKRWVKRDQSRVGSERDPLTKANGDPVAEWFKRNKIYFEVASYLVMPALAVFVAFKQFEITATQTEIQRQQLVMQSQPLIDIKLKPSTFAALQPRMVASFSEFEIHNRAGPAFLEDVQILVFADLAYGNGADSTCAYMVPLKNLNEKIYDRGNSDKMLAELAIGPVNWDEELETFARNFTDEDNDFIKLFMVMFLKIKYTDVQGTNRSVQYYIRAGSEPQRIGEMMWSRGQEIYQKKLSRGFFVDLHQQNGAGINKLFSFEYARLPEYCRPIGLHFADDFRGIFLD